jgi:hypothetical protein
MLNSDYLKILMIGFHLLGTIVANLYFIEFDNLPKNYYWEGIVRIKVNYRAANLTKNHGYLSLIK